MCGSFDISVGQLELGWLWEEVEGVPEVRGIPVRRRRERLPCEVLPAGSSDGT